MKYKTKIFMRRIKAISIAREKFVVNTFSHNCTAFKASLNLPCRADLASNHGSTDTVKMIYGLFHQGS